MANLSQGVRKPYFIVTKYFPLVKKETAVCLPWNLTSKISSAITFSHQWAVVFIQDCPDLFLFSSFFWWFFIFNLKKILMVLPNEYGVLSPGWASQTAEEFENHMAWQGFWALENQLFCGHGRQQQEVRITGSKDNQKIIKFLPLKHPLIQKVHSRPLQF